MVKYKCNFKDKSEPVSYEFSRYFTLKFNITANLAYPCSWTSYNNESIWNVFVIYPTFKSTNIQPPSFSYILMFSTAPLSCLYWYKRTQAPKNWVCGGDLVRVFDTINYWECGTKKNKKKLGAEELMFSGVLSRILSYT